MKVSSVCFQSLYHFFNPSAFNRFQFCSYHSRNDYDDSTAEKLAADKSQRDLIISVLEAHPSARDSRTYLRSFAPPLIPKFDPDAQLRDNVNSSVRLSPQISPTSFPISEAMPTTATFAASSDAFPPVKSQPLLCTTTDKSVSVADSILSAPHQHTGLVKVQGPFKDRQLESIVDGIIYLKKLGLMPIIVLDHEDWHRSKSIDFNQHRRAPGKLFLFEDRESSRQAILRETSRLTEMIEDRGGETRPMIETVLRLGDGRPSDGSVGLDVWIDNIQFLRSAVEHRQIPIIPPIAVNSSSTAVCISADEALRALAQALAKAGRGTSLPSDRNVLSDQEPDNPFAKILSKVSLSTTGPLQERIDLTPLRLMIINREGGIPSPARNGHPHLSINLASEFEFINETFRWHSSHPTSLANLKMAKSCLQYMPNESSAIIVSHRSPKSLIANLITNKPAHSPSLKHSILLSHHRDIEKASPTLIRKGLPIRVYRGFENIDQVKMTALLEASFGKSLDQAPFYARLQKCLRFTIIAGDYQGAAIVTNETDEDESSTSQEAIAYLDKFVVLPSLQGEGIVDFLWGALRDESFGLGCMDALNNNGGLGGIGQPIDLVWRSRSNNPVNRWYWQRSNGFVQMGQTNGSSKDGPSFSLFWCYAERSDVHTAVEGGSFERGSSAKNEQFMVDPGPIHRWYRVVKRIPSCWV